MQKSAAVPHPAAYAGQLGMLAGGYFAAAKLSLLLAIPPGYATAVWPPSGIALASALIFGSRIWPGIWLGAALVNLTVNSSLPAAVLIGSGNTLEALVGAVLIRRFVGVPDCFERGEDVVKFVALAALGSTVAATVGVSSLALGGAVAWQDYFANWWTWWEGDTAGMIIVTPLILSWTQRDAEAWFARRKAEGACLGLLLLITAWAVFANGTASLPSLPLIFAVLPFIIWAAFRFGQCEVTTVIAMVCAIAVWHTVEGRGPFASLPLNESLLLLLAFVSTIVTTGLVLSAVLGERARGMKDLRAAHDELESRVQERTRELEQANRNLSADVAARRRVERRLKESEQRFRLLIDGVQDYAIFMLDADGRVTSWNHGATKVEGYTAEQIIGRSFECFYVHEDVECGKPRQALELAARNGRHEDQGWRVRSDGSRFWANAIIAALRDEDGTLRGFATVARDISDRKQSEATRARLAAIVESSEDAILSRDLNGVILSWNAGAERLFGYAAAEAVGRDINLVPIELRREIEENRRLLGQGSRVSSYETVRVARDGRRIDVLLSGSPVRDNDGNVIGMASMMRDIGERKMAERALQKAHDELEQRVTERTAELSRINAELEKFAYVASHDLQEPLRTVINFSDLLKLRYRDKLDRDGREFLGFIVDSVSRMRRLIDDLLEFSRRGHERLVFQSVDCEALLQRVLVSLVQSAVECGAEVTRDPLPTVVADAGQIEQLLQNLIGNAIKYRGEERPRVHVGARRQAAEWVFSVSDNGIGIDPRFSQRIFEMFQRLHSGGKYAGSGVGLAICKKIAERHGGRIWVDSAEGRGATFYFTLPCDGADRDDGAPAGLPGAGAPA